MLIGEKYKVYLRVFFVMVIAVSLTIVLYTEIWWWSKNYVHDETVISNNFEVNTDKKVMLGQVLSSSYKSFKINDSIVADDARPLIIERYLTKYKSPLVPYSKLIFDLSQTYGFEYYWIVAIAQQESNLCKKIPNNSYNCWGYGIHKKGTLRFENYELALKSYAEYLKKVYFDKGLNTPELIMKKYCPSSNGSWAHGVQQFIDELESGSF